MRPDRSSCGTFVPSLVCPAGTSSFPASDAKLLVWGIFVTTDEELNLLEQQLRRLKIEYEMFFNAYRPPLAGRVGLRLDFNENTVGCSPRVRSDCRARFSSFLLEDSILTAINW